jgi:hypothetical protein
MLPEGLMVWANQLAVAASAGTLPPFNAGALAFSLVLTLVFVVVAIGLFERQEL